MLPSSFANFVSKIRVMIGMVSFWKAMLLAAAYAINTWSVMVFIMLGIAIMPNSQAKNPFPLLLWLFLLLLVLLIVFQIVFQFIEFIIEKHTDSERHIQLSIEGYIDSIKSINIFTLILVPFKFISFVLHKLRKTKICLI